MKKSGASKGPRKRKDVVRNEPADVEKETEQPPPPARTPSPSPQRRPVVSEHHAPALVELARTLRLAVGALLDLADAAAAVISKRMEGRA